MSTKNVTLHDENGNVLLPATKTSRVTDASGTNLDTLLQQAGQVKGISVNGTTQTIDANGNIELGDVSFFGDTVGNVTVADFNAQTDTVWNKTQVLSAAQQAQARTNIGAGTVSSVTVNGTTYTPTNGDVNLGSIGGGGGSGEANVIESISINGTAQTVTSKNVDLAVPTSSTITAIVTLTEAQYTALSTKDSSTLYIITS